MDDNERPALHRCVDFSGRNVLVTQSVATHIRRRHPEMIPFLDDVCEVLRAPDFVYRRARVGSHLFYKLGVLSGKLARTYIVVIVRYNEADEGTVRTMYPTTRPATGDDLVHIGER